MINNVDFGERLTRIMSFYQLSASAFADKIQVPRSSISHLLSGRNRPSLDFVLKVVKEFKEVELYWLLNGKGSFPAKGTPALPKDVSQATSQAASLADASPANTFPKPGSEEIERIVIFYKNGTFKEYLK